MTVCFDCPIHRLLPLERFVYVETISVAGETESRNLAQFPNKLQEGSPLKTNKSHSPCKLSSKCSSSGRHRYACSRLFAYTSSKHIVMYKSDFDVLAGKSCSSYQACCSCNSR